MAIGVYTWRSGEEFSIGYLSLYITQICIHYPNFNCYVPLKLFILWDNFCKYSSVWEDIGETSIRNTKICFVKVCVNLTIEK